MPKDVFHLVAVHHAHPFAPHVRARPLQHNARVVSPCSSHDCHYIKGRGLTLHSGTSKAYDVARRTRETGYLNRPASRLPPRRKRRSWPCNFDGPISAFADENNISGIRCYIESTPDISRPVGLERDERQTEARVPFPQRAWNELSLKRSSTPRLGASFPPFSLGSVNLRML